MRRLAYKLAKLLLRNFPTLIYLVYTEKTIEQPRAVEKLVQSSILICTALAVLYALLEVAYTSTCICTNILCTLVRQPFDHLHLAPIHILMLFTYMVGAFLPYMTYRAMTGKGEPRLAITGTGLLVYCYLLEDFTWHLIAWACGAYPFPHFCTWTRWPLEQLPFPWWYPPAIATTATILYLTHKWLQNNKQKQDQEQELLNTIQQLLNQHQKT